MIAASIPSLPDIWIPKVISNRGDLRICPRRTVDMFQEGNRTRRIGSRRQAVRIYQLCSRLGFALEDSTPGFGRDCGGHSIWA